MVLFRRQTAERVLRATQWVEEQRDDQPLERGRRERPARAYDRAWGTVQQDGDDYYLVDVAATRGGLPDLDEQGRLKIENPHGWRLLEGDFVGVEYQYTDEGGQWNVCEITTPFVHAYLIEPLYACDSALAITDQWTSSEGEDQTIEVYDDYGQVGPQSGSCRDPETGQWYLPEGAAVLARWLEDRQHWTLFFFSRCEGASSSDSCQQGYTGSLEVLATEPEREGDYLYLPVMRLTFADGLLVDVEEAGEREIYLCCESSGESVECDACDDNKAPAYVKVTIQGLLNSYCNQCESVNGEYLIPMSGCYGTAQFNTACNLLQIDVSFTQMPIVTVTLSFIALGSAQASKNVGHTNCMNLDVTFTGNEFQYYSLYCDISQATVRVQAI